MGFGIRTDPPAVKTRPPMRTPRPLRVRPSNIGLTAAMLLLAAVPLRGAEFYCDVNGERQTVELANDGLYAKLNGLFTVQESLLRVNGRPCDLTIRDGGRKDAPFFNVRKIRQLKRLADSDGEKTVWMELAVTPHKQDPSFGRTCCDQEYHVETSLRTLKDLPCLLVKSTLTYRGSSSPEISCFWGWFSGADYSEADGQRHEFSAQYQLLRPGPAWVHLHKTAGLDDGLALALHEGAFNATPSKAMLVFAQKKLNPKESLHLAFAAWYSRSAEDTGPLAEKARAALEDWK